MIPEFAMSKTIRLCRRLFHTLNKWFPSNNATSNDLWKFNSFVSVLSNDEKPGPSFGGRIPSRTWLIEMRRIHSTQTTN